MSRLRPASEDELPALTDLCLRSKAWWGYDAAFMAACVEELTLTKEDLSDTALIVLEQDGVPLGLAQIGWEGRYLELYKLFIDPPFIGAGHGRVLMHWAMDLARARGHTRLMVAADPGAEPFYDRFGAARHGFMASGSIPGRDLPWLAIDL